MFDRYVRYIGFLLKRILGRLQNLRRIDGVWIDVGAHLGEKTFQYAKANPSLSIYAFEPNIRLAVKLTGILPNYYAFPMAVSEHDGCADFYINSMDAASSLLPLSTEGLPHWIGGEELEIESNMKVPTIRLDTFMNLMEIQQVNYLKIDAQGTDLSVVKSAGKRIKDIDKITLEVSITPLPVYDGASNKDEIVDYLNESGFDLVETQRQSYDQEENLTFTRRLDR